MESTTDTTTVVTEPSNSDNGAEPVTTEPKTVDNKSESVPLATFLDMKKNAKQLEGKIGEMEAKQKAIDEGKLQADGKLQELIDSKSGELVTKQKELDGYKTKADEFEEFKQAKIKAAKITLDDKWDEGYAMLSLTALDKLVVSMTGVKASINVDGGASGDKVKVELTADQKIEAKAMYAHLPEAKAFEYHTHNLIKTGKIKKDK